MAERTEKKGERDYYDILKEKHITPVEEPNTTFLGHITPKDGTASVVASGIIEYLKEKNISTDSLAAIGSDGEVTNTGDKGGRIRNIEIDVNWFICILHCNELPFRHLFQKLDGTTTG